MGRAEAKTWAYSTDNYKKSNIVFYKAAFSSIRSLAHNMIHEFGHAVNFFNMNYGTYRGSHSAKESDKWGEREAFKFAFEHGGRPYKNDPWYIKNK